MSARPKSTGEERGLRVIVCGGRDFKDGESVFAVLQTIHNQTPISTIIEGGARGADEWGALWADSANIERRKFPANWDAYGKRAGPIRNQQMLGQGIDLVVAFPGGRGTADMVARAKRAGVRVVEPLRGTSPDDEHKEGE